MAPASRIVAPRSSIPSGPRSLSTALGYSLVTLLGESASCRGLLSNIPHTISLTENMSTSHPNQLGIPADPLNDGQAHELARVWSSQGYQYFVLNVASEAEPAAWGIFAIDLMKHAARAYQQLDGRSKEDTYKRILAGFAAEMKNPTEPL